MKTFIDNLRSTINAHEVNALQVKLRRECNRLELLDSTQGVVNDMLILIDELNRSPITSDQICEIETILLKSKRLF